MVPFHQRPANLLRCELQKMRTATHAERDHFVKFDHPDCRPAGGRPSMATRVKLTRSWRKITWNLTSYRRICGMATVCSDMLPRKEIITKKKQHSTAERCVLIVSFSECYSSINVCCGMTTTAAVRCLRRVFTSGNVNRAESAQKQVHQRLNAMMKRCSTGWKSTITAPVGVMARLSSLHTTQFCPAHYNAGRRSRKFARSAFNEIQTCQHNR